MRTNLLFIAILNVSFLFAQSGDDINNANVVDGTSVSVNALDYDSATASGLSPSCGTGAEDVFYKHDVTNGDNKITIGRTSTAIVVATTIEYQILKAINGDTNNLVEIACSSYDVALVAGGSFEEVIQDVNDADDYYLRVYKTSSLGGSLTGLLNGTTITMDSEFDASLSSNSVAQQKIRIITNANSVSLSNNDNIFTRYSIYSITGKLVNRAEQITNSKIDISLLKGGFYILNLEGNNGKQLTYKFIKK